MAKMALGKKCGPIVECEYEELGLGFVRYSRSFSFGRKRVSISDNMDADDSLVASPTKKRCGERIPEKSPLEALPQDILIRILCGVDHEDLKQLFQVSKSVREATLIAKQCHFEYSTPKKTTGFRDPVSTEDKGDFDDEIEAPNAPKQHRIGRSRLSQKRLADISVALFASPEEEMCPRRDLLWEIEAEI